MVAFIDEHRDEHGVEPIAAVLPIAPSTYYELKARQADPDRRPARDWQDVIDRGHVRRVWQASGGRYGVRKVWEYTAMRYTDRLAEADIAPSVGSVGDSFDNAMAESIIGLYKAEVIHHRDRWDSLEQVEWETMRWDAWFTG